MSASPHSPQEPAPGPAGELEDLRRRVSELEQLNSALADEHEKLERISRIFHVTHALAVAMQSANDIAEIHERVLTLITAELGYQRAILAVADPHDVVLTGWLCSTSVPGAHLKRIAHTARLPLDDESWLLAAALRSCAPALVRGDEPPTGDDEINRLLGLRGYAVLPMVLLGKPLGILIVDNPVSGRALTVADRDLLQHVASHAAVMIGGIQAVVSRAQRLAVEEERTRIALEIHDAISQQLYGITYTINACARQLPGQPEAVREQLLYVLPQAQHAAQALRRAIFDLWPDDLDSTRFKEELTGYLEEIAPPPRPRLFLQVDPIFDSLAVSVRRQLYRIAQEALNNAVKHAAARQAKLTLVLQGGELIMRIADNGRGFDPAAVMADGPSGGHYGFSSMRERAEAIGGNIRVDSAPNEGTTLTVTVSLARGGLEGS